MGRYVNPGGVDTVACMSRGFQENLEDDLTKWYKDYSAMVPGSSHYDSKPGSAIVFVREWGQAFTNEEGNKDYNWARYFFCESWHSPNDKWKIVFDEPNDKCYVDEGGSPLASTSVAI